MAKKDVERLVGRAFLDAEFREKLFADPEATIQEAGFDLTPKEIAQLKRGRQGKGRGIGRRDGSHARRNLEIAKQISRHGILSGDSGPTRSVPVLADRAT